jgi:hypothetical protein
MKFSGSPILGVLQSSISKIIILDVIIFGVIPKKVGPALKQSGIGGCVG